MSVINPEHLLTYMNDEFCPMGGAVEWNKRYNLTKNLKIIEVLEGEVNSKAAFFRAVSILLSRPNSFNKNVFSTSSKFGIMTSNIETQDKEMIDHLQKSLAEPITLSTLAYLEKANITQVECIRRILFKTSNRCEIYERWNFQNPSVEFLPVRRVFVEDEYEKLVPALVGKFRCLKRGDKFIATLTLRGDAKYQSDVYWAEEFKNKIFRKFIKWASSDPGHTSIGIGPTSSLTLISHETYQCAYKRMKKTHMRPMFEIWNQSKESTNPSKYVPEDIAIASYLEILQTDELMKMKKRFVDMGCGNGLLAYILSSEGWDGVGIDIRKRRLWNFLPNMENKLKVDDLRLKTFDASPYADENTLFIGNHPDEVTPWIPLIASRTRSPFFIIPCCAYGLNGKYEKLKFESCKKKLSTYESYIKYLLYICNMLGYECGIEKLRIPSTKRLAIIGVYTAQPIVVPEVSRFLHMVGSAEKEYVDSMKSIKKSTDIRNCTSLPKDEINAVVNTIFSILIERALELDRCIPFEMGITWNRGSQNVSLNDLVKELGPETLKLLKSQNKGLQTLIRNHSFLFKIEYGMVRLRVPDPSERERLVKVNPLKINSKPCYYNNNHPDGCPLLQDKCCFRHNSECNDLSDSLKLLGI